MTVGEVSGSQYSGAWSGEFYGEASVMDVEVEEAPGSVTGAFGVSSTDGGAGFKSVYSERINESEEDRELLIRWVTSWSRNHYSLQGPSPPAWSGEGMGNPHFSFWSLAPGWRSGFRGFIRCA